VVLGHKYLLYITPTGNPLLSVVIHTETDWKHCSHFELKYERMMRKMTRHNKPYYHAQAGLTGISMTTACTLYKWWQAMESRTSFWLPHQQNLLRILFLSQTADLWT